MKIKYLSLLVLMVLILVMAIPVLPVWATLGTAYNHIIPFTITDTSGVARTNVPVIITYDVSGNLIDYGLVNATATDTNISRGSGGTETALNYLMATDNFTVVVPSLPAYGSVTVNLYTGYAPEQTSFPMVFGNGGYETIIDNETMEPADNFTLTLTDTFVDTSASGTLLSKTNALDIYNVQNYDYLVARLNNKTDETYNGSDDNIYEIAGNYWYGQTFQAPADGQLVYITFVAEHEGTAPATYYCAIYETTGSPALPTGMALDTVIFHSSDISAKTDYQIPLPLSAGITNGTTYAFVLYTVGGDASNNIRVYRDSTSPSYGSGTLIRSTDSGGSFSSVTADLNFTVSCYVGIKSEIATGEHDIELSADGTNLTLSIDGVVEDTVALSGASVPDNANNWIIGSSATPYIGSFVLEVDGVEVCNHTPSALISSDTIPDTSGNSNDGTITWGTNSDITLVEGMLVTSHSATSVGSTSVLMNGELESLGDYADVYVSFEYGLTSSFGYFTSETSIDATQEFSVTLTGLNPNTTYYYRAVARYGTKYAYGEVISFTTIVSGTSGGSTTPIITTAGVFGGYMSAGDLIITAEITLTYPPYYPTENPEQYFQMQLVDTDGTTILGASPITMWGDRPTSIYLNPTVVSNNITQGAAYYIKVVSISDNLSVSESYTLESTDWKGTDLSNLDTWCISVATNMQLTDGTSLTDPYITTITDYGIVITDAAGGFFTKGIPGLAQVRPNLFQTGIQTVDFNDNDDTVDYNSGTDLEDMVGSTINDDATTVGGLLGLDAQQTLNYLVMACIVGAVLFVVSMTKGWGALGALCLAVPVLGASTYLNITGIVLVGLVMVICAFLFVRQMWFKTV